MIQITFNFKDIAAAAALFYKLNGNEIGAITNAASVAEPLPVAIVPPLPQIVPPSTDQFPAPGMPAVAQAKTETMLANEAALADTKGDTPGQAAARRVAEALGTTPEAMMAPNAILQDLKFVEAPGKPSAAPTARSPRTAAAAPSTPAPSPAAPATQTTATPPAAAANSALTYADLQKVVLQLHSIDPTATVPIAKALGFDSFKPLKEPANAGKIPAAHAAVVAKIAEIKGA